MEIEKIFTKDWLCVGRVEEFQNPGDYRAFRIAEEPVLLCRDTSGTLHGFANVCRHRGVEIATGEGNLKKFNCPYHAWMYDLDRTADLGSELNRRRGPKDVLDRCRSPIPVFATRVPATFPR